MSEATVERYEVEERSFEARETDVIVVERDDTRGELLKFAIVVVVLFFTVVIIALLRPLIFNTILPAVLGEGQPTAPIVDETEAETIKPEVEESEESEAIEDGDAVDTEEAEGEGVDSSAEDTPEGTEPEKPEDFPTAVPAQSHTVQAGENLTAIAQRYGVTVQTIVDANDIPNPNNVAVGTVLIIPVDQ